MHVRVTAVDAKGRTVPTADDEITFSVEGDARIVATDNGDMTCDERHTSPVRSLHQGTAMVILRAGLSPARIILKASSRRFPTKEIVVQSK
jgi:beta-galactosidase